MNIRVVIAGFFWCCVATAPALAQGAVFPFSATVNAEKVNIRAGQNKNFEVIGALTRGNTVVVVDQSYSWYKIRLPEDARAYVSRKLVRMLGDDIGEISAGGRVNIRARAALESAVMGQLVQGTLVRVVETQDEWLRIAPVDGVYGWIAADFAAFQSLQVPATQTVQRPDPGLRPSADDARQNAGLPPAGQPLPKVDVQGTVTVLAADAPADGVRHQITADDGTVVYLSGYDRVPDGFLNAPVHLEGLPQGGDDSAHPVLRVTRVLLML